MKSFVLTASVISALHAASAQLFTVNCDPLTTFRGDPIVSPGQVSSHVHTVTGGTNFQVTEPNSVAIAANATTCDKILDHSNYWVPQLYHQNTNGTFSLVPFLGNAAYYLNRACNYTANEQYCPSGYYAQAPPAGLRMVSGDPTRRTFDSSDFAQKAIQHMCLNTDSSHEYNSLPPETCNHIRAEVFFPSCWDGVNLDSADHKSHMAFPASGDYNFGVCPQSHPVAIYSVFYEFFFDTSAYTDFNRWVYANGDPTGYGFHGDFLNGWTDQGRLDSAMTTCTGNNGVNDPGCSLNVGLDGPGHYSLQPLQNSPATNEQVGFSGPLAALPGNNPVTGTPIKHRAAVKARKEAF